MAIKDIFTRNKKVITSKESGKSGTQINAGVIINEEYNFTLQGEWALKTYNEMRSNDATVGASLDIIMTPLLGADFYLDPVSDDPKDIEVRDMVYDNLFHIINFERAKNEILTFLPFGFSLFEMVFEPMDINGVPRVGMSKFAYRKQTTIQKWETDDGQPGVTQSVSGERLSIPELKLVRFTNRQEGDNYAGRSILRPAYKHWYMKDKLYKLDMLAHERHSLGVLDIVEPDNATDTDKRKMMAAARALRASDNGFIMHKKAWELNFMKNDAQSLKDSEPSINHHDRQIMKNVLAAFMEIGSSGSSGTRSVSEDQSRIFALAVENVGKYIVDVLQNTVVRTLVDLNYNDRDYPKLRIGKTSDENVPVLSEAVAKYVTAGALHPRAEDENTIRKQLGWAEADVEELEELFNAKKPAPAKDDEPVDEKLEASVTDLRQLRASVEKALYDRHKKAA